MNTHPDASGRQGAAPRDVDEQVASFAATGQLADLDPRFKVDAADKNSAVTVMCLTSATVGVGVCLLLTAIRSGSSTTIGVALMLTAIGLAVLLPSLRRVRSQHQGVTIRAGAVLPPELVRVGHWIHRHGAWARIQELGPDSGGDHAALLSTGEVIHLTSPVTIAGDAYRPAAADRVKSLLR